MEIIQYFAQECCATNIEAKTKDEVLKIISALATKSPKLKNVSQENLYTEFVKKEAEGSTGFGKGIAIPHIYVDDIEDTLLFVVSSKKGVPFDSLDKKKVHCLFVIVGRTGETTRHLQIMASISRSIAHQHLKEEMLSANTSERMQEAFVRNIHVKVQEHTIAKEKMKLLYVILYDEDMLYNVLEYFIQEGIDGASIVDAQGMNAYISNAPLFASFIGFMNERKIHSKIIMTLIPEKRLNEIIDGIENITGDFETQAGAMIMALDVATYRGTMNIFS